MGDRKETPWMVNTLCSYARDEVIVLPWFVVAVVCDLASWIWVSLSIARMVLLLIWWLMLGGCEGYCELMRGE